MAQAARLWLESIHPITPWALMTLGIFLVVFGTRKFLPALWLWFDSVTPDGTVSHVVQGLPSVLVGALLTAGLTPQGNYSEIWKGMLAGALAPVVHIILKKVPGPYQGAVSAIAVRAGIAALALMIVGCGGSFEEAKIAGLKDRGAIGAKPPPTERCITLDDRRQFMGGTAKGAALLGGASGLAALPIDSDTPHGKEIKISLAIGGLVMGGIAITAQTIADGASKSWVAECQ